MTEPHGKDITEMLPGDPRERRRIVVRSGLRVLATTAGLLILYAIVPVPGRSGAAAIRMTTRLPNQSSACSRRK